MSKKQERAKEIAVKCVLLMCEDETINLMWKQADDSWRKSILQKMQYVASSHLEEYAGSIPIEPTKKLILVMPDEVSSSHIFLKNKTTGDLMPMVLVKKHKEEEDAEQPTPESPV